MRSRVAILTLCLMLFASPALGAGEAFGTYYEIFVASFYDSDGEGTGDLPGVLEKLDYLNDGGAGSGESLGVDGLWLMPVFPSPSYHKYDVTDYYDIDPAYGTLADFHALAQACEERGVRLLLDGVFNHTSSLHPWFRSAALSLPVPPCGQAICPLDPLCREHNPYVGYYHFTEENRADYHPVPDAPGWYYEGAFGSHMPDLALENEAVQEEILDICAFWLEQGAGGFRLDAVTHYFGGNSAQNTAFLAWLMESLRALSPDIYLVAEAWTDESGILSLYASGIPSFFNFPFGDSSGVLLQSLRSGDGAGFARKVEAWQQRLQAAAPGAVDAVFLSNHDQARSGGMLLGDLPKQKLAAALYLLLPGNAFVYYGEELGMLGSGEDPLKRQPFLWSADDPTGQTLPPEGMVYPRQIRTGAAEQWAHGDSLLRCYQNLIRVKSAYPILGRGTVVAVETENGAVALLQYAWQGEQVLVAHNLSGEPVNLPWPYGGTMVEMLPGEGSAALAEAQLLLQPFSSAVVKIR